MAIYDETGARYRRGNLPVTIVADPEVELNEDLYRTRPYDVVDDDAAGGAIRTLIARKGTVIRQSVLDANFPAPFTITGFSPSEPPLAFDTPITVTGHGLKDVTEAFVSSENSEGGSSGQNCVITSATDTVVTFNLAAAVDADMTITGVSLADGDSEVEFYPNAPTSDF